MRREEVRFPSIHAPLAHFIRGNQSLEPVSHTQPVMELMEAGVSGPSGINKKVILNVPEEANFKQNSGILDPCLPSWWRHFGLNRGEADLCVSWNQPRPAGVKSQMSTSVQDHKSTDYC